VRAAAFPRPAPAWAARLRRLGRPGRLVVVDAGTDALTAIEVERRGGQLAIAAALRRERAEGEPWTDDTLAAALGGWQAAARVRARRAIFVASPLRSIAARVELPAMPARDRAGALRWELARLRGGDPDGLLVEALVDAAGEPTGRPGRARLAVAVEAAHADGLVRLAAAAGLRPVGIAATAAALRALGAHLAAPSCPGPVPAEAAPPPAGDGRHGTLVLVEAGAARTQVACFRGRRLEFVREVGLGGRAITEALTGAVAAGGGRSRLGLAEAEAAKRRLDLAAAEGAPGRDPSLFPLVRPVLERLAAEIAMSIRYYQEQLGGASAGEVWLLGGGASLAGLDRWLEAQLGLPVRRPDPLAAVEVRPAARPALAAHPAAAFGVAVGAALAGLPGSGLLPPAVRREARWRRAIAAGWAALSLAVAAGAGAGAWHRAEARRAEALLHALTPQAAAAERALRARAEAARRAEALRPGVERSRRLLDEEPYWDGWLKELSHALPREVTLRELRVGPERAARLTGSARDGARPAAEALLGLVERLQASPFLAGVRLAAGREAGAGLDFEILGRLE
jgi:Tfp pilus assembly PilM family ATPase